MAKLDAYMEADLVLNMTHASYSLQAAETCIQHISDILDTRQSTIAVFTRGECLEIRDNNTGSTGNWVIDPDKRVDKIVIYYREQNRGISVNELFMGDFVWPEGPVDDKKRYKLHFKNLERMGVTDKNWKQFTDGGANPVKYINMA